MSSNDHFSASGRNRDRAAPPTRVLLSIHNPAYRTGVRTLLDKFAGLDVVGAVGSSRELRQEWQRTRADVVLADPICDSISELLSDLAGFTGADGRIPAVLLVPEQVSDEALLAAAAARVGGLVTKNDPIETVARAVVAVHAGQTWVGSTIGGRLLALVSDHRAGVSAYTGDELTPREREVLEQLAEGRSNSEIAETLVVTVRTVKHHVSNVLAKLGARDRAHAVAIVLRGAPGAGPGTGRDRLAVQGRQRLDPRRPVAR